MLNVTAFATLLKRKRGEMRLTQETLALDIFGDGTRKADISRLENAKVPNPQEATIQKLCKALNISAAEMEPIRQSRVSATQLDNIPTLSREDLQNLASRFEIENPFDRSDADLRQFLTLKADEYRALKTEVDAINDGMKRLANLKAAAQDAIARVDLEEVENLLSIVHATELDEAAKTAELRANNALLRGKTDAAFTLLITAAQSFTSSDSFEPEIRLHRYAIIMYRHGMRYAGNALHLSVLMNRRALERMVNKKPKNLWSDLQNNLGNALSEQGNRTNSIEGTRMLADAAAAFRLALEGRTRKDHPLDWAMIQSNLGNTLAEHVSQAQMVLSCLKNLSPD